MKNGQSGFTLIEIIAVLVLLGVLAAVIVPKYNSMVADAKNSAAKQAVAEGMSRVNAAAASYLMTSGSTSVGPSNVIAITGAATNAGDYDLTFTADGTTGVAITAVGRTGSGASGGSAAGTAQLPN